MKFDGRDIKLGSQPTEDVLVERFPFPVGTQLTLGNVKSDCALIDLSTGGVLGTSEASLEAGDAVELTLPGCGEKPVQIVWVRGSKFGAQFIAPLEPNELHLVLWANAVGSAPNILTSSVVGCTYDATYPVTCRDSERLPINFDATLRHGGHEVPLSIVNVSRSGFLASSSTFVAIGSKAELAVPGGTLLPCVVTWAFQGRVAAKFEEPISWEEVFRLGCEEDL